LLRGPTGAIALTVADGTCANTRCGANRAMPVSADYARLDGMSAVEIFVAALGGRELRERPATPQLLYGIFLERSQWVISQSFQ